MRRAVVGSGDVRTYVTGDVMRRTTAASVLAIVGGEQEYGTRV
ncbi:hypothetical protein [Kribbella rubisoli]|nr:hypothetical protein [Kribbella rubisoli]